MVKRKASGGGLRDPRKPAGKGAKQRRKTRRAVKFHHKVEAPGNAQQQTASNPRTSTAAARSKRIAQQIPKTHDSTPGTQEKLSHYARKHGSEVSNALATAARRWEKLRDGNADAQTRHRAAQDVLSMVQGKCATLALNHKGSRILQALLKHGASEHWHAVANELEPHIAELAQSQYASFLVSKLLRSARGLRRTKLLKAFRGRITRLARHERASRVLTVAYAYANGRERSLMAAEFYGKEFMLFGIGGVKGEAHGTDGKVRSPLERGHSNRAEIVQALARNLIPILEKGLLGNELVHAVLLDYLHHAGDRAVEDAALSITNVAILRMLHSREGVECASILFLAMSAKDRKGILKAMRESVDEMARDKHAHAFVMCVLDAADDTVALAQNVIRPLLQPHGAKSFRNARLLSLMRHPFGRRPLLHLICPRSQRHFPPETLHTLPKREGNTCGLQTPSTSKKDPHVRRLELLGPSAGVAAMLVRECKASPRILLSSRLGSDVLCEVLLGGSGGAVSRCVDEDALQSLLNAVADVACIPSIANANDAIGESGAEEKSNEVVQESTDERVIESFFGSRALRRLAKASSNAADTLYTNALKGRVYELVDSHAAKVVAACAYNSSSQHAGSVKAELASKLGTQKKANEWLSQFIKPDASSVSR